MRPTLLAVAHGTRSTTGRRQIRDLVATVARRRPDLDVRLAYVDVQRPHVREVVADIRHPHAAVVQPVHLTAAKPSRVAAMHHSSMHETIAGVEGRHTREAVVVPLLLSAGYHVRVDIAEAVAGTGIPVTATLGPDDVLVESLTRNLPAADAVVLAAAGSSDPAWRQSIHQVAAKIKGHVAYASGSGPKVSDVVAGLRAKGARRIAVAAYLLADGLFYRTLHRAGADFVTPPLCLDPALAGLVLRRYESAILTTADRRL